jgi:hypothetical protein
VIKLGLIAQTTEDDLCREAGVAGIEWFGLLEEEVGGESAIVNPAKHFERDQAGGAYAGSRLGVLHLRAKAV